MGRFNQNQIRGVCQGFLDGIINYIGGYMGGSMVKVEEGGINLKFTLRRSRVYAWVILMKLFLDVWQFLYMNLNGLMHIWIVGEPRQIINSFLMFQYGRGLDNFPRG